MLWHLGREVKAADSKSAGLCPRRFESCRCRSNIFGEIFLPKNFLEFLILTIYKEILSGVFDFNNYKEILSGVFDFNNKKKSKCLEWGSNPRLHRRIELKSTALDHSAIEAGT